MKDYYRSADSLAPFFSGSPWDPEAYRRKAREIDSRIDTAHRERIAEAIRPTSDAAAAKLKEVVAGDGLFVTTGQQAGLFTGPLFTIYKALTAVRLARTLERVLERPVAPLFWIASDDHDWDEVNHVHVLDRHNEIRRITVAGAEDGPPHSMARRRLGDEVEAALGEIAEVLPPTEFAEAVLEPLRSAYRPGRTVAEAFGDTLAHLLSRFDLLMVDPAHPVVKEMSADVLRRELEHAADHEALLAEHTDRLVKAGYHTQVPVLAGATNVFYEDEHGRERVFRGDHGWVLRRTGRTVAADELERLLEEAPERFSPNVMLRPVVESTVFPTAAYVAGPGELSYYAQLGCLFEAHGILMPLIHPRFSVTLVEGKIRKVLDKFGLEVDDFRPPVHELAARVLKEELPDDVRQALGSLRGAMAQGANRLAEAAMAIDPTLKGPVFGVRNTAFVELNELEKKIVQHLKSQNDIAVQQLEKARRNLFPSGDPQERVLNIYQYLVRYGPELLDRLAEAMEIRIDADAPAWAGLECG